MIALNGHPDGTDVSKHTHLTDEEIVQTLLYWLMLSPGSMLLLLLL